MAKKKSSTSQLNISPASSVENDQAITLSASSGNELFVLDQTGLDKVEKELSKGLDFINDFSLNIYNYREVVENLDSVIANSPFGPVGRIPTLTMDDDGIVHGAFDIRGNETSAGGDQDPIEVCYFRAKAGGKVLHKKVIGKRLLTGSGVDAARSRVMDPTILNAGNGKLFILAGRWFSGATNWTTSGSDSANAWSAAILLKSTDGGNNWTQNTIGKANAANQEGTHITVTNLPSDCKGFLGGVGPGIKHSSGKLIFAVQWTTGNGDCKSALLICDNPDTNDMEWRFSSGDTGGTNYEPSIMELPNGDIVLLCRSEDTNSVVIDNSMKKAFITKDFGDNFTTYEPLNLKIGSTAGNGGGNRCQGAMCGFTTKKNVFCTVLAQTQNTKDADLGSTSDWGRNKITVYAADVNKSSVYPIDMLNYFSGLTPTSSGDASTSGTPFGGYNNIIYKRCKDGEYLIAIYEDKLGISMKNISHLIPRLEMFCSTFVNNEEVASMVNDEISVSAEPIVKSLVKEEIDYIGYTTIGPVYITDVKSDLASVDDEGSLLDSRSGIKYPKGNTGTNKPTMGTGDESGLIIYDSEGQSDDVEKTYTQIVDESGVLGLTPPFTVAFELKYSQNGDGDWPSVFRMYNDPTLTSEDYRLYGCNIGKVPASDGSIIFNPFNVSTTGQSNTFRMKNSEGCKQGDTIHYVFIVKEDGKTLHYINGVEVNNTTAYSGSSGTDSSNLPAPGEGFVQNNPYSTIKRIAIGNDVAGLKTYRLGFGNLKFYNKQLSTSEISELYSRRKEYLNALKTGYKYGYVGAINEIFDSISGVVNNSNSVKDNLNTFFNLIDLCNSTTIPHSDKLVLNLSTELIKKNTRYNGLPINGNSDSYIYLSNLNKISVGESGSVISEGELLNNKESSYATTEVCLNKAEGYIRVGKDLKSSYLDIESLGVKFNESFTLQVFFKNLSAISSNWSIALALKVDKGRGTITSNSSKDKSLRFEVSTTNDTSELHLGGDGVGLTGGNMGNLKGTNNMNKFTIAYNADDQTIKAYTDSETATLNGRMTSPYNEVFGCILLAPGGVNESKYADVEFHRIRLWKGVALSGDEVVASLS